MEMEKGTATTYVATGTARIPRRVAVEVLRCDDCEARPERVLECDCEGTGFVVVTRVEVTLRPVRTRRYLTRKGAINGLAVELMRAHCECERGDCDVGVSDFVCRFHNGRTSARLQERLVRWLRWLDRKKRTALRVARMEIA